MAVLRCPQGRSSTDELEELWCVEYDLIEECYMQFVESGGIDPGQDLLQIFADPLESNFGETGCSLLQGGELRPQQSLPHRRSAIAYCQTVHGERRRPVPVQSTHLPLERELAVV